MKNSRKQNTTEVEHSVRMRKTYASWINPTFIKSEKKSNGSGRKRSKDQIEQSKKKECTDENKRQIKSI